MFAVIALCCPIGLQGAEDAKPPIPDEASQQEAKAVIKEVYGDEYQKAKTNKDRLAVARKLLSKANDEGNEPAARYVLLTMSRDAATQSADCTAAFDAIDALSQSFAVPTLEWKAGVLKKVVGLARAADQLRAVADESLRLSELAIQEDNWTMASEVAQIGLTAARKAKESALTKTLGDRVAEIKQLQAEFVAAQSALAVLDKQPTDPEANLTVGKYRCLVKGDWDGGLPMLALGSDEALKAVATQELNSIEAASARAALGDQWWDLAEKATGRTRLKLQGRAAHWYQSATKGLTSLAKAKVDKRLAALGGVGVSDSAVEKGGVTADKLVIWNTRHAGHNDRGTAECSVALRRNGKTVWSHEGVKLNWREGKDLSTEIRLPKLSFDAVRVNITEVIKDGGGLSEIEVWRGRTNIAAGKPVSASAAFSYQTYPPASLVDGVKGSETENLGYWLLPDRVTGWAEVQVESTPVKPGPDGWIDLLPNIDFERDRTHQRWLIDREKLTLPGHGGWARVMLPVVVPKDYDLAVEFTRQSGDEAVFFVLPVGKVNAFLQISGWHGTVAGIAFIDGVSADANASRHSPSQLANNQRYAVLIKVRLQGEMATVDALLDGEPHIHWTGKQSSITPETAAWLPAPQRPGVGGGSDPFVFTSIKIRPASGKVTLLSPAGTD